MVFNDTSTRQGLIQDCEDLCNLSATQISGNTTLLQTFTRNINQWYLKSIAWLLASDTRWQWDDSNYTDLPRGTANLVNAQQDYTLPASTAGGNFSTFLKLLKVAYLDKSGNEVIIHPTSQDEAHLRRIYTTTGQPQFYKLVGNSIKLFPAPDNGVTVTLTSGLICYFQRTPDLFTTSDTTQQPGIPQPFHRILSLGASYDFASSKGLSNKNDIRTELEVLKGEIQQFFSLRNQEVRTRMSVRKESYK